MAKVTFIGDPRGEGFTDPAVCEMFGMSFPINQAVEVENEAHLTKLSRNSHFHVDDGAAPEPDEKPAQKAKKPRKAKAKADGENEE